MSWFSALNAGDQADDSMQLTHDQELNHMRSKWLETVDLNKKLQEQLETMTKELTAELNSALREVDEKKQEVTVAKLRASEAETARAAAEAMVGGLERAVAEARVQIDGKKSL